MPNWDSNSPRDFGWDPAFSAWVPFVYLGHNFPSGVHPAAVHVFTAALDRLVTAGLKLPPVSMGLEAGCWGAESRNIGSSSTRSFHSYGLAIDVAAPWNAQGLINPEPSPYRLPDNTSALVEPLMILWGGSPRFAPRYDRMHLEVHGSPAELATLALPVGTQPPVTHPYPLPSGDYYGPFSGPASSISGSGRSDAPYRAGLALAQARLGVAADGYYGPVTATATLLWQTRHGLLRDGLIGPATWASLFHA